MRNLKRSKYCINPLELREASLDKPESLEVAYPEPENIKEVKAFINMDEAELANLMEAMGFAMSFEDLKFCREYFKTYEKEILP